jgi:hypothetical protein
MRSILHIHGRKFVPDEVYNKLPNPIKKIMDETIGCYARAKFLLSVVIRREDQDSLEKEGYLQSH